MPQDFVQVACREEKMERNVIRKHELNSNLGDTLTYDILVSIFSTFPLLELIVNFSGVCDFWNRACADPSLWEAQTLDLSMLQNYYFVPNMINSWTEPDRSNLLARILNRAFTLSRGNISKLIFHFNTSIDDEHLILAARRCPRMTKLVLPVTNRLTLRGLHIALRAWGASLETVMIPYLFENPISLVLMMLGQNCPALRVLKFMSPLTNEIANCLVEYLPQLKALSVRGAVVHKEALKKMLKKMPNLEELNINHSLLIYGPVTDYVRAYPAVDDSEIMYGAARLSRVWNCNKLVCGTCHQKYIQMPAARSQVRLYWYSNYRQEFWRTDEIESLSY